MSKGFIDNTLDLELESPDEIEKNPSFRPKTLKTFTGQKRNIENLQTYIYASKKRAEALDHVLLSGPPGLGKTTLAHIIALEMGVNIVATSAPALEKTGDIAAILTALEPTSVLFIDEIHRLRPALEEFLYSAMEDFQMDIVIGQGPGARTIKIDIAPFTLVGATTRPGMLTSPLQNRFGIDIHMDFYDQQDLIEILKQKACLMGIVVDKAAAQEIAKRSRGTPRILQKLLRRIWDFSLVEGDKKISSSVVLKAMEAMQIDDYGFTKNDIRLMHTMYQNYNGGPVGLSTLSVIMGDSEDAIQDIYEPFLVREGFIQKTPRGRILTHKAYRYFGFTPSQTLEDIALFPSDL